MDRATCKTIEHPISTCLPVQEAFGCSDVKIVLEMNEGELENGLYFTRRRSFSDDIEACPMHFVFFMRCVVLRSATMRQDTLFLSIFYLNFENLPCLQHNKILP